MQADAAPRKIVILAPAGREEAARTAAKLVARLSDATGLAPRLLSIAGEGAPGADELAAVQAADLVITLDHSPQVDALAALAALRGASVNAAPMDRLALFATLEERLGRPGLGGWLAAAESGPVALVDWARANPADPLARSAALGMTPAEHRAMVVGPGVTPQEVATPDAPAQQPREQAATADLALPEGDLPGAPPKADMGRRWDRFAGPLLMAALSAILFLAALWLGDLDKAVDRQFLSVVGFLAAVTSGLVAWWWPIPMEAGGRATFVLRYMAIVGGLLVLALGFLFFFKNPEELISWFGLAFAAAIAGGAILFSLLVGAIGMVIGRAARRAGRLDTLAFGSLAVVVAAVAIGAWQSFLFMSDSEKIAALDAQLARVGLDDCSKEEADRTLEARVRVAETALGEAATGHWSPDLLEKLEARPAKSTFILAADGSGDGRTVPEIARKLCRVPSDVRIEIRPGTYDLTDDDKFRLNDGDMRLDQNAKTDRKLVLAGSGSEGNRPVFTLRGLAAFGFNSSAGWASVSISDVDFEDGPALPSAESEPWDKVALYFGVPTELRRIAIRSARQSAGLKFGYEADRLQPMLLDDVDLRHRDGSAFEVDGSHYLEAIDDKPLPPFTVQVVGGSITSRAHNPIYVTGPATLEIRNARLSTDDRDLYCIGLSGAARYTASGLTMQCAGSPTGSTAAERAGEQ